MEGAKINKMSFGQSAALWWAILWRTILISIIPMIILNLVFVNYFKFTETNVTALINLLLIPVMIQVQRHVINHQGFGSFDIQIVEMNNEE